MKILVLGGGVIGVTTAWCLAEDGHEVGVVDRQPLVANETSYGNAGLVSPGHALSWASPRAPLAMLRSLFDRSAPLRFRLRPDPRMWIWCLQFLGHCTDARWRANSLRKLEICRYSLQVLEELVAETGIEFHRRKGGVLYLQRSARALEEAAAHLRVLSDAGLAIEVLDADACVAMEPALAADRDGIAGALLCRDDESGDCNLFTQNLAGLCADRGVEFHFETKILGLNAEGGEIREVETDKGAMDADAYVMALGSYSPIHARRLGVGLPIYPLKGYSITLPVIENGGAPEMSGVDEQYLLAWSRFGDRLRLTSVAEFAGYDTSPDHARYALMLDLARRMFPAGIDYDNPSVWAGLRPMTPQGTPIHGRGPHNNLWYNTGHGSMGWSMACASAKITADLIAGRSPAVNLEGLIPQ